MDILENALNDVMTKRLIFGNISINSKVRNRILIKDDVKIKEFLDSLDNFYKKLTTTTISDIELRKFIQIHNTKLEKIKSTLVSSDKEFYKNIYDDSLITIMKSNYDRIFIRTRYKQQIDNLEADATRYFTEFAKGITYFKNESYNQEGRRPIYHRNASCGSKQLTSTQRFKKETYGPDKHKFIYRCLLERLIYDRIYQNTLRMQDLGHKVELEIVQRIYDKYFPDRSLKIIGFYYDDEYPINLEIGIYNKDKLIEKKTYTKELINNLYKNNVECTKEDYLNNKYYEKIQTFDKKEVWTESIKDIRSEPEIYRLTFDGGYIMKY